MQGSNGWLILLFLMALAAAGAGCVAGDDEAPSGDAGLPPDYTQIIPRGRIAAIDDPTFVTADEAEISGDAWVLGVVIDGVAKAYSLNLLNHHEVVNDRFGELPVAAVW